MAIWFLKDYKAIPASLNAYLGNHIHGRLNIEYTDIGEDWIKAQMPCTPVTHNPMGIMHGGAISLFADSVGGVSTNACVDRSVTNYVTLNLSINFFSSVREGMIYATAHPVQVGKSTAVTNVEVTSEKGKLIAVACLTMANYVRPS